MSLSARLNHLSYRPCHPITYYGSLPLAISQVFVNRLIAFTGMSLHAGNWRSVLLTALLIAQKVWDDRCLVNGQFSLICPMFTVSKLNMLEKRFLEFLDYDVNISSRLYAKYYFELRALSEEQSNRAFALQPLNAKEARRLEVRISSVICAHEYPLSVCFICILLPDVIFVLLV